MKTASFFFACIIWIFMAVLPVAGADNNRQPGQPSARDRLPLAAGIAVNKAEQMFQAGEIQTAIETLEEFIARADKTGEKIKPEVIRAKGYHHPYLYFLLGNYYLSLGEGQTDTPVSLTQKAAKYYRFSVEKDPGFSPAWLNLAKCSYETEDFKAAALAFENGYKTSPTPKPVHLYYAAICYYQSNDSHRALEVFNSLLADHPGDVTLTWKETLVHILFSLDRHQQALSHIEELAKKSLPPKLGQWRETLLHQYLMLDMDEKALSYATGLTQTDPAEPKWWKALCHIHLKSGHRKKGLSALILYGFLTPMTREEQLLAADLYLSLDIPERAAVLYREVVSRASDPALPDSGTLEKLTQAFVMAHDPANALKWLEIAVSALPEQSLDSTGDSTPDSKQTRFTDLKNYILHMKEIYEKASFVLKPAS
ncbi:MAG: tetratricopeptide repeat protein [Desulfobacterales bacterium]|nr:tetratricopeptide repeat protein [Desulfobacterales bacterium]